MRWMIVAAGMLAGCSGTPASDSRGAAAAAPMPVEAPAVAMPLLAGRWTGVEGMYLAISPGVAGRYRMEMQYDLDHKGVFEGEATPQGLVFTRDGKRELLRPTGGDATGLKYLAAKTNCLTAKPGEGYCRD